MEFGDFKSYIHKWFLADWARSALSIQLCFVNDITYVHVKTAPLFGRPIMVTIEPSVGYI